MFDKEIITDAAIHPLLAKRWSGRAFDPERAVETDDILALLEAARWAPSCYGDEPWRFIVAAGKSHPETWQALHSCLAEGNQGWAKNAPLLILAIAGNKLRNGEPNRWGSYDTGAAMMSLSIQATALGLMCHQMGGFDPDKAVKAFGIPADYLPMAVMAVGYQLATDAIPEALQEREFAERKRRPLTEHFFSGDWGESYQT
ncbi:MAG: nitroreductase family protein [Gammaproteobacteria bacterium]